MPISEEIRKKCEDIQAEGRLRVESVRWSDPNQFHLTLLFLGELERPHDLQVKEVVRDIAGNIPPFSVEIGHLGTFPEQKAPKVIWLGVSMSPLLMMMQDKLKNAVAALDIPLEMRPYRPHLTLGRVRKEGRGADDRLALWIKKQEARQLGQCKMNEIWLMESELKPEGPLYHCLLAAPLIG